MGEGQSLNPDQQVKLAREQFEQGRDLTLAVEEEFALIDPETLGLVNAFEDVEAAVQGTPLAEHLAGELISAEAEVRTGRCETFAQAAATIAERRAQLLEACEGPGVFLSATGAHPWSSWKDVRLIDTVHYRRVAEALKYVAWRNQTFALHLHVGVRGADRAVQLCSALRNVLPELLALSASSPFAEDVCTGLHSTRTQLFTRVFPRCGVPDEFADWDEYERYLRFLYSTGSIEEHTQIWWSVRPHLAFPTVEIRICDGQPTLAEAQALSAFIYALAARMLRALDEGEPLPSYPRRLIEENLWRAIRRGMSGDLIDLSTETVLPARARLEQLVEWIQPVVGELGVAQYIGVPAANAAERQIARYDEGAPIREVFAAELLVRERVGG